MYHSNPSDPQRENKKLAFTAGYDVGYAAAPWFAGEPSHQVPKEYEAYTDEWGNGYHIGFLTRKRKLDNELQRADQ